MLEQNLGISQGQAERKSEQEHKEGDGEGSHENFGNDKRWSW